MSHRRSNSALICLSLAMIGGCDLRSPPAAAPAAASGGISLTDLSGRPVAPFDSNDAVNAFVFARTDCPIVNRYAPVIRGLADAFAKRGIRFWLVFLDPDQPADEIRRHLDEFDYGCTAIRDPGHTLAHFTQAEVTGEAAVFDKNNELVYCGRIDDRVKGFGRIRPEATRHELREALEAVLAGEAVSPSRKKAVGCYIRDLSR